MKIKGTHTYIGADNKQEPVRKDIELDILGFDNLNLTGKNIDEFYVALYFNNAEDVVTTGEVGELADYKFNNVSAFYNGYANGPEHIREIEIRLEDTDNYYNRNIITAKVSTMNGATEEFVNQLWNELDSIVEVETGSSIDDNLGAEKEKADQRRAQAEEDELKIDGDYAPDVIEEAQKIFDTCKLEGADIYIDKDGVSVLVKDTVSNTGFWFDIFPSKEGDLEGDWNQYIFHNNFGDQVRSALQNNGRFFEAVFEVAENYAMEKEAIKWNDETNKYEFKTESKKVNKKENKKGIGRYLKEDFYDGDGDYDEADWEEEAMGEEREDVEEYIISFEPGELYDQYHGEFITEDKEEADDLFDEIKEEHKLDQVDQYIRKVWEWDRVNEEYYETDVEVYFNAGDELEYYDESKKTEGYSLGDDKESFDVYKHTAEFLNKVGKALEDLGWKFNKEKGKFEKEDITIDMEAIQDNVNDLYIGSNKLKLSKFVDDFSGYEDIGEDTGIIYYVSTKAGDYEARQLASKINSCEKLEESKEIKTEKDHFNKAELTAVKNSIDTALDDLQLTSTGTTGDYEDRALRDDLRNVGNFVDRYITRMGESKKVTEAVENLKIGDVVIATPFDDDLYSSIYTDSEGKYTGRAAGVIYDLYNGKCDIVNVGIVDLYLDENNNYTGKYKFDRNFEHTYYTTLKGVPINSRKVELVKNNDLKNDILYRYDIVMNSKSAPKEVLKFQQTTDSRYDKDAYMLLQKRLKELENKLNIKGVKFDYTEPSWVPCDGYDQWVSNCTVKKTAKNVTWENIYEIVNSIKAVPYKLVVESKKVTEAKSTNKKLDYKLDGFKGVNIIVVDKKNNIDTEEYMNFDSMEFGIDEYEFEDDMVDGIKEILTDIYEYTDDYYDDRFTKDEITEMAEDITQDVLQLYDDLPDELIDFENGIANLNTVKSTLGKSEKTEAKPEEADKEIWEKVEHIVDAADNELGPDQSNEYEYDEHIKFVIYRDFEYEDIFEVYTYVDGEVQGDLDTGDVHLEDLDATMVDIVKKLQSKEVKTESRYIVYDYADGDTMQDEEEKGLEPSQFTIYDNKADDFYYDELGNNPVFDKEEDAEEYIKKNLTETKYGDSNPDKIVPDAYCDIEKTDSGYYINCGIGTHTNLGSGNFTIYPENYLSNLHKEVKKLAKERGIKRVYDKVKTMIPEYNAMIPEYNANIEDMIKNLTPFAEKSKQGQLTRADLDSIEEITGKITPNRMSTLPEFEWGGKFGRLRSLIGNLKRYETDLSNPLARADTITITESKEVKTEAEDMTAVKDNIEKAKEDTESTEQEIEQVKGSLEVLKTDEEEAIAGYDTFVDNSAKVVDDELANAIDDEMQEIIQDEKDHIEKLDTIKTSLGESKEVTSVPYKTEKEARAGVRSLKKAGIEARIEKQDDGTFVVISKYKKEEANTLGENKKTEASVTKFQTLTVDKDGNEMLLKDVSYNNACSWLEKELAKAGSKVVDTEIKGNKTIIKADNKTRFEYDEEKGTLKRLEEAIDPEAVKEKVEKAKADIGLKQAEEMVDTENELTEGIKKEIIQYAKQQGLDVEKLQKQGELNSVAEALDNIIGEMVSKSANEFMDTTGKNIEWDFEVKDNNINVIWNEV